MSIINNRFLSLSTKIKLQQASNQPKKEVIQDEPQKQEASSQKDAPIIDIPKEKALNNDFLLTYRGININHIETAETKTPVTTTSRGVSSNTPEPEQKPVSVDKSIVLKSSLASAYKSAASRVTPSLSLSSGLKTITDMASSDLASLANTIKAQLKKDLGANYDEKSVKEAIDKAIQQTIKEFTDNKTKKSKSYKAQAGDNGFVFSRTSIFGIRGKYSYNVQSLSNKFIENLNSNFKVQFEDSVKQKELQKREVEKTKTKLKEKQEEYAKKYMRSIPSPLLYSFDKVYESALEGINTQNYNEAQTIVEQYLQEKFNSVYGRDNADKLLSLTQDYYEEQYGGLYGDGKFSKVFEDAKAEVLKNIDNSKNCNTEDLVNNFDSQVRYLVNDYMDAQLEQAVSTPSVSTRSVSSDPKIITSLRDIPKEPSVNEIKGKNGAVITITNYSFYFRDTSYIRTMKDKDGVHYPNATIDITLPNGEKYSLNVGIANLNGYAKRNPDNQAPPISAIDKLAETLGSLQAGVLDSFCKEIHFVKIQDANSSFAGMYTYDETMTLTYRSEKKGDYGQVLAPEINNINGYVITHELGHAIDFNKESSSQMKQFEDTFNKLKNSGDYKKFVKENIYALADFNEFFAEYYTYTKYGTTSKQGQKVFKQLEKDAQKNPELKNLLDGMNKIISDTEKLSKEERQNNKMSPYDLQAATERAKKEAAAKKENTDTTNNNQEGHKLPSDEVTDVDPAPPSPPAPPADDNQDGQDDHKHDKDINDEHNPQVKPPRPQEKPSVETDNDDEGKTQDKKPSAEPDAPPSPANPDNKETDNNSVENGKETYKPFEQKPGAEGIGNLPSTNAETLSQQKAQELYEKYGDGYDIKVNATTNPDGTITIDYSVTKNGTGSGNGTGTDNGGGKLPDGPTGGITGGSGAGEIDRDNTPGLDKDGKIPVKNNTNNGTQGGSSSSTILPGTNIDLMDPKYHKTDGAYDMGRLIQDLAAVGEAFTTTDQAVIKDLLRQVQNRYGQRASTTWDKYWSELGFGYAGSLNISPEDLWGSSTGPQDNDYFNSITAGYAAAQQAAQEAENIKNQQPPPSTAGYTSGYDSGSTDGYSNGYNNGYDGTYNYTHKGTAGYSNGYYNGY